MGMITSTNVKLKGIITITERNAKTGEIISVDRYENLTTTKLHTALADVLSGDYDVAKHTIGYLAVGTDDTAANAADTELGAQIGANKAYVPGSLHNDTTATKAEATFFFDSDETTYFATWAEVGLYAANGTDLLTHSILDPGKTFDDTKTITVNYVIEIA